MEAKRQVDVVSKLNQDMEKTEAKMKKIDSQFDKFVANTNDKKVIWYIVGQLVLMVILIILS